MYQSDPKHGPSTPFEWLIFAIFGLVILGLFGFAIFQDYTPTKLAGLLVVLFWIPLLALHEGGHAIASALLGWRVGHIVIGMGKLLGSFRIGTARVEIRLIPVEGFVLCVPQRLRFPQLESAIIYFAGPGIELLLAWGILLAVGSERLLSRSEEYEVIIWQSLALAAAAQGIINLIPAAVHTQSGRLTYNDGLGIITSFLQPTSYYANQIGALDDYEPQPWETPADWWKRDN